MVQTVGVAVFVGPGDNAGAMAGPRRPPEPVIVVSVSLRGGAEDCTEDWAGGAVPYVCSSRDRLRAPRAWPSSARPRTVDSSDRNTVSWMCDAGVRPPSGRADSAAPAGPTGSASTDPCARRMAAGGSDAVAAPGTPAPRPASKTTPTSIRCARRDSGPRPPLYLYNVRDDVPIMAAFLSGWRYQLT